MVRRHARKAVAVTLMMLWLIGAGAGVWACAGPRASGGSGIACAQCACGCGAQGGACCDRGSGDAMSAQRPSAQKCLCNSEAGAGSEAALPQTQRAGGAEQPAQPTALASASRDAGGRTASWVREPPQRRPGPLARTAASLRSPPIA